MGVYVNILRNKIDHPSKEGDAFVSPLDVEARVGSDPGMARPDGRRRGAPPGRRPIAQWTSDHELCMVYTAQSMPVRQIARQLRRRPETVLRWRGTPEFRARLAVYLEAIHEEVRHLGIASVAARVAARDRRWQALQALWQARKERAVLEDWERECPGASSGLLDRIPLYTAQGVFVGHRYFWDVALLQGLNDLEAAVSRDLDPCGEYGREGVQAARSVPSCSSPSALETLSVLRDLSSSSPYPRSIEEVKALSGQFASRLRAMQT